MANFHIPSTYPFAGTIVQIPHELKQSSLLSFRPFNTWLNTLSKSLEQQQDSKHPFHSSPYSLHSIQVQAVDFFGGGRIGFLKLKASISNKDGESLPGAVFMRGGSVAMLLVLTPNDPEKGDEYAVLTVQPRVAAGSLGFVEIPAGMIDDAGTFGGAAAKEIQEETGLDIKESELVDMTQLAIDSLPETKRSGEVHLQSAIYPSPGGCDEFIPIFLAKKQMERKDIEELKGKLTGLRDHGEKITVKIVKLNELWKHGVRDGKTMASIALYEGLKREGKI